MTNRPIAYPEVRVVRWLDSSLQNGQVDKDDFPTPVVIASIGFVVDETNGHITLARDDMGHDGDYRGLVSIPQRAVLTVERLAEHGQAETGVDSHPLHPPPTQKGGRHTMTSHQVPIGQVTGLFASVEPDQFGQTVDELFSAARAISNAVVDEVEQKSITPIQGAAVVANVTGCLFGWPEFHREVRPADLALMQLGQVQGQVHGDGQ